MDIKLDYFQSIQGTNGLHSSKEYVTRQSQSQFQRDISKSIGYEPLATRNGIPQPVVLAGGKTPHKSKVVALPGEGLEVGDIISCNENNWIIVGVTQTNPIQKIGEAWLCNQLFRFQNFDSTIIERWGVLDSGAYSKTEDKQVQTADSWYRIFLPYDNDTKKLYVDKRFAVNKCYNSKGEEILTAYKITSIDPVSKNYGKNGHLLVIVAESSPYQISEDNIEELICNYIATSGSEGEVSPTLLSCSISAGRSTIRTGTSYTFEVVFYESDGVTENNSVDAVWSIDRNIAGITSLVNGNSIRVSVANNDSLVGEAFVLSVVDSEGLYNATTMNVGVV